MGLKFNPFTGSLDLAGGGNISTLSDVDTNAPVVENLLFEQNDSTSGLRNVGGTTKGAITFQPSIGSSRVTKVKVVLRNGNAEVGTGTISARIMGTSANAPDEGNIIATSTTTYDASVLPMTPIEVVFEFDNITINSATLYAFELEGINYTKSIDIYGKNTSTTNSAIYRKVGAAAWSLLDSDDAYIKVIYESDGALPAVDDVLTYNGTSWVHGAAPAPAAKQALSLALTATDAVAGVVTIRLQLSAAHIAYDTEDMTYDTDTITIVKAARYRISFNCSVYSDQAVDSQQNVTVQPVINGTAVVPNKYVQVVHTADGRKPSAFQAFTTLRDLEIGDTIEVRCSATDAFVAGRDITVEEI